jgi:1,4-dihydroxy-2-naphthoate octaprenyltransferase
MKKLLIEFSGTLILSLILVIGAIQDSWMVASVSTGLVLMGLIYSGGHVSFGY